jgi:hypothetical protein
MKEKPTLNIGHTFQKQCELSQFLITSANSSRHKLSIPIDKSTKRFFVKDVRISNNENWQDELWKNITTAYKSSPFFIYYDFKIEPLFTKEYDFLFDFNREAIEIFMGCLKTDCELKFSEEPIFYKETEFYETKSYPQVFDNLHGFTPNLSILDLIMNIGPESSDYLQQ